MQVKRKWEINGNTVPTIVQEQTLQKPGAIRKYPTLEIYSEILQKNICCIWFDNTLRM
jgi:hypothetical protein